VTTRPVERQDEATTFTPPPDQLVRRSRRESAEQTQFTPVPEGLLGQSRGDWPAEPTTAAAPSATLLAQARRARRPSDEHTAFTPPPQSLLDGLRREELDGSSVTAPRALAPTVNEADMTAVTPLTSVTPTAPVPPRTLTPRRSATPHSVPLIGPLPTHERDTPLPQIVAAPFSPPRPLIPSNAPVDWGAPAPGSAPVLPPLDAPSAMPPPVAGFDMGRLAAREALIRRLIWVIVLLAATLVGVVLATKL
jgi:hypothetical protein